MKDALRACVVHCVKLARVFRQSRRAVEGVRQHPTIWDHDIVAAARAPKPRENDALVRVEIHSERGRDARMKIPLRELFIQPHASLTISAPRFVSPSSPIR